ncbi:hypothetical protein [Crocosphaera chwakensis]|uniref:Uncharacterized protein n=1 Tax=Crocosphaera chwakensis CCY0110 TaxID=391612 RepID=A3IXV0_9CHRO|nr:hypothetical protein [Crocosphaera chwakensis]EAZ88708.1 hypothetical protein CY0110_14285 [Crocosphaera chwakensis CCY0110]
MKNLQAIALGISTLTLTCVPAIAQHHAPIPNLYGLEYEKAREKLISHGWQPHVTEYSFRSTTPRPLWTEYGNGKWLLEKGFWEVSSCSGTGLAPCLFEFVDVYGNYLEVKTIGQVDEQLDQGPGVEQWQVYSKSITNRGKTRERDMRGNLDNFAGFSV